MVCEFRFAAFVLSLVLILPGVGNADRCYVWYSYLDEIDRITAKMYFPTDGETRVLPAHVLGHLIHGLNTRRRLEGEAENYGRDGTLVYTRPSRLSRRRLEDL